MDPTPFFQIKFTIKIKKIVNKKQITAHKKNLTLNFINVDVF